MEIEVQDTCTLLSQMYSMPTDERKFFFRQQLMMPFERMWTTINVPMIAKKPNGYDVLMATEMLGLLKPDDDEKFRIGIEALRNARAWEVAKSSLIEIYEYVRGSGPVDGLDKVLLGLYLGDPEKYKHHNGYTGFGGIPGYILLMIYPNEYNLPRLPALIAHEFHHNIRLLHIKWDHANITLGEYIVIEGLADAFAEEMYGRALIGPWVTDFPQDDLEYSIEVIRSNFGLKGFGNISSYMFGDRIADTMGYPKVGLSDFAGYAVGYNLVSRFLKKNRMSVLEATCLSAEEILSINISS